MESSSIHGMNVFPCGFLEICIGDSFVSQLFEISQQMSFDFIKSSLVMGVEKNRSPFDNILTWMSVDL